MRIARISLLALLALPALFCHCQTSTVKADDAKPAAKPEPWKSEDIIYGEYAAPQTRISPDAKWLAWVKSTGDKDKVFIFVAGG